MGIAKRLKANPASAGDVFSQVLWVLAPIQNPHHHLPQGLCLFSSSNRTVLLSIILCFYKSLQLTGNCSPSVSQEATCGHEILWHREFTPPGPAHTGFHNSHTPQCGFKFLSLSLWVCDQAVCLQFILPSIDLELSYLLKPTRYQNGEVILFYFLMNSS